MVTWTPFMKRDTLSYFECFYILIIFCLLLFQCSEQGKHNYIHFHAIVADAAISGMYFSQHNPTPNSDGQEIFSRGKCFVIIFTSSRNNPCYSFYSMNEENNLYDRMSNQQPFSGRITFV